jgi:pimeloyl-ACP methyl ester carboxylesterase
MDFLKQNDEIDPAKIGLIGHSEGGLIAPIVATSRDDVAFIVMLAGPGVTGKEILLNQTALIAKAEAASDVEIEVQTECLNVMFDLMAEGKTGDEIKSGLRDRFNELRDNLPKEKQVDLTPAMLDTSVAQFLSPWFRYFISYDPRPALTKLRCPVLALNGELDLQVDPDLNLPVIREALQEGGNADAQVIEMPGLNHLFQAATTGSPTEYRTIEETMSPIALKAISDWLSERF